MKRLIIGSAIFLSIAALTAWVAFGSGGGSAAVGLTSARDTAAIAETLRKAAIQPFTGNTTRIDFELHNLAERSRSLADYRGQVVLLNFWATWCPPCVAEMPSMQRLSDELHDAGLTLLAVNVQEDPDSVHRFVQEHDLSMEVLLDRNGRTGQAYGVRGLPTSVILDRSGAVVGRKIGFAIWDEPETVAALRTLLEQL